MVCAGIGTAVQAEDDPVLEDLGGFGGSYGSAHGISADGTVVVGVSENEKENERAFRWVFAASGGVKSNPQMYRLGTFGPYIRPDSALPYPDERPGISAAYDVNADGTVVVGESRKTVDYGIYDSDDAMAFRWVLGGKDGVEGNPQMQDLGVLGGEDRCGWECYVTFFSSAYGVNADGTVVVGISSSDPDGTAHAFRWVEGATGGVTDNPQMYDLGTLNTGASKWYIGSSAEAVSADGTVVVGGSDLEDGVVPQPGWWNDVHAFRWVEGATGGVENNPQMYDLGTLDGRYSEAFDVSDDGTVVVGISSYAPDLDTDLYAHAFRWVEGATQGVASNPEMFDLGTLGGSLSSADGVNADGTVVVGMSLDEAGQTRAFRWEEGGTDGVAGNPQMQNLGTLTDRDKSKATDVSADGTVVVGTSWNMNEWYDNDERPFIWRSGTILDYQNVATEVLGAVAHQMGALEARNGVVAGVLGTEVDFGGLVATDGTLSTKGESGELSVPLGLRLETGLASDGSDTAAFAGLVVAGAVAPGLSIGAHFSRGYDGDTTGGFRFTGPYDTFGGYLRGGDRYDGFTFKLAVASSDGTTRIARPGALPDTEAGSGKAGVDTLSASAEVAYALPVTARTIVAPLLRLTRSRTTRAAYDEDNGVAFPVSFDAATSGLTTVTLGADMFHAVSERLTLRASLAAEADLARNSAAISGSSAIPGLTSFSLKPLSPDYPVRLNAGAGATYALGANNAITFDAGLRQNAFTGDFTVGGALSYEIRF